jgi:glutathione S-transferase
MRLYYSQDPNPRVAVAVARYLQAPVLLVAVNPRELQNERSADALGAVDPCTPVPMLIEESRTLWETDAIACRLSSLARSELWPAGDLAPELQTWLSWGRGFNRAASAFHHHFCVRKAREPAASGSLTAAAEAFHRFAGVLEEVLSRRTWLIGNRLTYADFRVATPLPFAAAARLPVWRYPHILRWHERLCRLSAWACPWPDAGASAGAAATRAARISVGERRLEGGRPVAVRDAVVHGAEGRPAARQGDGLDWLQARHPLGGPGGGELLDLEGHEH